MALFAKNVKYCRVQLLAGVANRFNKFYKSKKSTYENLSLTREGRVVLSMRYTVFIFTTSLFGDQSREPKLQTPGERNVS